MAKRWVYMPMEPIGTGNAAGTEARLEVNDSIRGVVGQLIFRDMRCICWTDCVLGGSEADDWILKRPMI